MRQTTLRALQTVIGFLVLANSLLAQSADVSVTKADSPDPVAAGADISYTIVIGNAGPNTATAVVLSDVIPANTTFFSSFVNAGALICASAGGTFQCTLASLPASGTAQVTLTVNVNPGTTGSISNTATVSAATSDPDGTNNSASATTAVLSDADLSVTKTDSPDPVPAGSNIDYVLTVTNNGPAIAQSIVLSDVIPANTTFVSSFVNAGPLICAPPAGGTFQCTRATLNASGTVQVTLTVNVNPGATGTISNTATVTTATNDPNGTNNSASTTTTVLSDADLSVTKTDSPDPVTAGSNIDYLLTVTNNGPAIAQSIVLSDVIPANTTFVSSFVNAGPLICAPPAGGTFQCTRATLNASASAQVTLTVNVNPGATGTISNTATVTTTTNDPNNANNSATELTTVTAVNADVSVTKTDAPDPVTEGQNITYTITVANAGPATATSVDLQDIVPAGTTFVSFTAPAGWSATTPSVGGVGLVEATNPSLTIADGPQIFTLVVNVNVGATSPITNVATVTNAVSDPATGNNVSTATTTVSALSADLSVTKTDTPDPVTAGQNITYTITVNNAGPNPASAVSLSDAIPAGTTFVSLTSPGGWTPTTPPVGGTGTVTATNPSLAVATPSVFTLVVNVNAATTGTVTNTATVTSTTPDSNNANNSATATTTVNALAVNADLAITKVAGAGPFFAGGNVNFTITVTNNGPAAATSVTVVDTLPAGSTLVSATPSQGSCTGTGPVNCALGGLAASGSATIALVVRSSSTPGTLTNTATVSAAQTDPNPANNTTTANATTGPAPIPTLSEWMLLALALALGGLGLALLRGR